MAETLRLRLAHVVQVGKLRDRDDLFQLRRLSPSFERELELEGTVEMVFDGPLRPARDDQDVVEAGVGRFLHDVLDRGSIDQRQHLFRLRLGRGEEACAQACGRDHNLAYGNHHHSVIGARPYRVKSSSSPPCRSFGSFAGFEG